MICRHCHNSLQHVFLDLGFAPPSNAYLSKEDLNKPEQYFPLKLFVCEYCWLVQTEDYAQATELFNSDYAYFSSTSKSWLAHAKDYCEMITERLGLNQNSHVVEVASNDGYLLRNFVEASIPCLGIEPTISTAVVAEKFEIPVLREFFGEALASHLAAEGKQADLILGNNVYAHVPDINDFTLGLKTLLKLGGTITLEFPHLAHLLEQTQFDTVYHEHYSYLSLYVVNRIFEQSGLRVFDVEELSTHGGSLRVYGCHASDPRANSQSVRKVLADEVKRGMRSLAIYKAFQNNVERVKDDLLLFLVEQKRAGKTVVGYGAAAKGCTLLNYAGIKPDLLPYVCDAAPSKQGKYLPGTHVPILPPDVIFERKPDIVLILPWNIKSEVINQMSSVREWGGIFMVAIPQMGIC